MRDKNAIDDETETDSETNSTEWRGGELSDDAGGEKQWADHADEEFQKTQERVFDSPIPRRTDPAEKRGKSIDEILKERYPDATPMERDTNKRLRAIQDALETLVEEQTDRPPAFTDRP